MLLWSGEKEVKEEVYGKAAEGYKSRRVAEQREDIMRPPHRRKLTFDALSAGSE